jgi:hypothetical protein
MHERAVIFIRRRNYLGCPDAVLLKARVGFPVAILTTGIRLGNGYSQGQMRSDDHDMIVIFKGQGLFPQSIAAGLSENSGVALQLGAGFNSPAQSYFILVSTKRFSSKTCLFFNI